MLTTRRRHFLRMLSLNALAAQLSGCGGGTSAAPADGATPTPTPLPPPTQLPAPAPEPELPPSPAPAQPSVTAPWPTVMPASTGRMAFTLVSTQSGTSLPFCLGFAFRRGDVKEGQWPVSINASLQTTVKNRWPDGSLKFAMLAGRADLLAGQPLRVELGLSAVAPAGTALTLAQLRDVAGTATVDAGGFGRATWAGEQWLSPFSSWASGPEMSSWVFRQPVGKDAHLVAWLEVRLYAGGAVEALPWIENGYLNVAGPTSKAATFSFAWGGATRFSRPIDLPHHCRTPLLDGERLTHWLGNDPGITYRHDVLYLQATELVPSYIANVSPDATIVRQLAGTYLPLQQGNFSYSNDDMASSGYAPPIGLLPEHDVLYLTCNSTCTYAAVIRNGFSAGRYALHYRDETTNRPLRFSKYPNLVLSDGSAIKDNGASTINNVTPRSSGTSAPKWDPAHSPSIGHLAYLLSGQWYFMEQMQFAATLHYLWNTDSAARRSGASGLMRPVPGAVQTRATAWTIRTLAQALSSTPDEDADIRRELAASFEANVSYFHNTYVNRKNNPFGLLANEDYGGAAFHRASPWMNDFCVAAFGYALAMGLPISSEANQKHLNFFEWLARSVVGRLGPKTDFWYINATPYTLAYSPSKYPDFEGGGGPWFQDWKAIYDATFNYYSAQAWVGATEGVLAGESLPGATAYWGNIQPAVAYAVRHGVEGAFEAMRRMERASNWPKLKLAFNDSPVWGVKAPGTPIARQPSWLSGVSLNQWVAIPGSVLAGSAAAPNEDPKNPYVSSNMAVRAYSGMALRDDTSEIFLAAVGGHQDSSDNAVRSIMLMENQPSWIVRCPPSAPADRRPDMPYYADGKPISRHTYWSTHWSRLRGRVMLHRTRFAYGSAQSFDNSNGFDPDSDRWDPAGSWSNGHTAQCRDDEDNVWAMSGTTLLRWSPMTDQWDKTGTFTGAEFPQGPLAWDPHRQQLFAFAWGDGQGYGQPAISAWVISQNGTRREVVSFVENNALRQFNADKPVYAALDYDLSNDRYLFYSGQTGATQRVYIVRPNTTNIWSIELLSIDVRSAVPLDAGPGGVMNKFRYVPALGGFVLMSSSIGPLHFLRTM